ncbi:MAG: hypothetical protein ACOX4I_00300 [Anaerovoracaceae bacterium]|jgi:hypothetical protein
MYSKTSKKSKAIAMIIALLMVMTCFAYTQTDKASAASPEMTSYKLATYSGREVNDAQDLNQHVELTLTFNGDVAITDEDALNASIFPDSGSAAAPSEVIKIAGSSIASNIDADYYYRPCTYKADGNQLIIDIGNVVDKNGNPDFTAIYNGSFTAEGTLNGITVGGESGPVAVNIAETRIPIGIKMKNVNDDNNNPTWDTSKLTMQLTHKANVRGMYHFAVYKVSSESTDEAPVYIPVTTSKGQMGQYTVTSHAHMFYDMDTTTLAKSMTSALNASLIDGYTATVDGSNITITSENTNDKLRMYIFDDNYLQANKNVKFNTPDPGISFAGSAAGTLNSKDAYVPYTLNVTDEDGVAAWAASVDKITVDGVDYSLTTQDPINELGKGYSYTGRSGITNYAYLYKQNGKFMLNIASAPLDTAAASSTHQLSIVNSEFGELTQRITINKPAAPKPAPVIKVARARIYSLKNKNTRTLIVRIRKMSGVRGYQVKYSKYKSLKKARYKSSRKVTVTIKKLTRNKRYYVKVRAYKLNKQGKKVYGAWSLTKSIKIRR